MKLCEVSDEPWKELSSREVVRLKKDWDFREAIAILGEIEANWRGKGIRVLRFRVKSVKMNEKWKFNVKSLGGI